MSTPVAITTQRRFEATPDKENGYTYKYTHIVPGQQEVTLKGEDALANSNDVLSLEWQKAHPLEALRRKYRHNDGFFHAIGRSLRGDQPKTAVGRAFDGISPNPILRALAGAAIGGGIGTLGGYVHDILPAMDEEGNPVPRAQVGSIIPGLLGAALVGGIGYMRAKNENSVFGKSASYFKDPRNYVLECLASDTTASVADKAKLAVAVQKLDYEAAEKLKNKLRADGMLDNAANIIGTFVTGADWKEKNEHKLAKNLISMFMPDQLAYAQGQALGAFIAKSACNFDNACIEEMHKEASDDMTSKQELCATACIITKYAGYDRASQIYAALADAPSVISHGTLTRLTNSIADALGEAAIMKKQATITDSISNILDLGSKLMIVPSIAGGSALGALAWKLNRDAHTIDAEAEAKRAQAKRYRELSKDINKAIASQGKKDARKEHAGEAKRNAAEAAASIANENSNNESYIV